jgi:hypothetical protein
VDDTNNPPGETAAEQATNAEKIAQLQSQLSAAASDLSSLTSTVAIQGALIEDVSEAVDGVYDLKLNKPTDDGADGQFLRSNGDGTTRWDSGMDEAEVSAAVTEWLEENVSGGETIAVDKSLTITDAAADAKVVGDELTNLKADLGNIETKISALAVIETGYSIDVSTVEYVQGYLNSDGTIIATTGTNAQKTTAPIPLEPGDYTIAFSGMNGTTAVTHVRAVAVYNANDECTNYYQTQGLNSFTVEDTDSYVRFNAQYSSVSEYILESDVEATVAIKPNVAIPTDSTLNENKPANAKAVGDAIRGLNIPSLWYMPYRRPLVAFNFDGEYNKNPAFKAKFDEHGKKCGFAIPYTNNFPYTTKETYLSWQAEGFEIMAHSAVAVCTQSSLTDEEIQQVVKNAYSTLEGYGFNIHGFVAYQGNSKQVAITEAQRIYDYGMTMPNHAGDLTDDRARANVYFSQDQPYNLWRYSMQNSTLQQMQDAVDTCYATNGLILFYGHANASALNNMTLENIDALLTYIESKGIPIVTPYEAIKDFYAVRPQDFVTN